MMGLDRFLAALQRRGASFYEEYLCGCRCHHVDPHAGEPAADSPLAARIDAIAQIPAAQISGTRCSTAPVPTATPPRTTPVPRTPAPTTPSVTAKRATTQELKPVTPGVAEEDATTRLASTTRGVPTSRVSTRGAAVPSPRPAPVSDPTATVASPGATSGKTPAGPPIREVMKAFFESQIGRQYFERRPTLPEDPAARWRVFSLALLRLPDADRARWRVRTSHLAPPTADSPVRVLPTLGASRVLLPAWPGSDHVTVRLDPAAPLLTEVAEALGQPRPASPLFKFGVLASQILTVAELDQYILDTTDPASPKPQPLWEPDVLARFRDRLLERLSELSRAGVDDPLMLHAMAGADEALRSVIHLPLAAPDSWWSNRRRESLSIIQGLVKQLVADGHDVEVDALDGGYERILTAGLTAHDQDVPIADAKRAGLVGASLRLFTRVRQDRRTGRVIYFGD